MYRGYEQRQLFSASGGVIGVILDVVPAADGVSAEWLVVDPGVMRPHRWVPVHIIEDAHGKLTAPLTIEQLEACPVEADGRCLDQTTVEVLRRHYGLVPG